MFGSNKLIIPRSCYKLFLLWMESTGLINMGMCIRNNMGRKKKMDTGFHMKFTCIHLQSFNLLFSLNIMIFAIGSKILMKNPRDTTVF